MDLDPNASVAAVAPLVSRPPNASAGDPSRLVDGLAQIVAQAGYERLVCAVLVLADPSHFPDRWQGGPASATRVALRLVHYAGLEGMDVEVQTVDADSTSPTSRPEVRPGEALAAWFVGLEPGKIVLAIDRRALGDPLLVVASLARAIAQAFAVIYNIVKRDGEPKNELVDLCAAYLGFGVVTTNAALRYLNSSGGGVARVQNLGALRWQEQCYVLAVIAQLRRLSKNDVETLGRCLSREQQESFREQSAELRQQDGDALASRLGLPAARYWPAPVDVGAVLKPLPAPKENEAALDRGIVGQNRGKPVFRVERRMGLRMFKIGLGASFAAGMLLRLDSTTHVDPSAMAVCTFAGVVGLTVLGALFKESRCSDGKCDAKLKADERMCPRCAGEIVGVIAHPKERLAAEEKWLAAQREKVQASESLVSGEVSAQDGVPELRGVGTATT